MKRSSRVDWVPAPDVKRRVLHLSKKLNLEWLKASKIYCFRSNNSKSRAFARIWGLTRIWQIALDTKPAYVVEVLSEKFDGLSQDKKDKILLHELAHIPKNFSGSLLPHIRKRGKRNFHDRVNRMVTQHLKNK